METSQSVFVSLGDNSDPCNNNEHKICALQNGVALLFAFSNMILNFLVIAIIHERVPDGEKLPDISFELLPEYAWGLDAAEYIISIMAFISFTLLFLHRYRVILFRRLCLIMGVIYFARAICMFSTQVPLIKRDYCAPKMTDAQRASWSYYIPEIFRRAFSMMLGFGLSMNHRHVYCGDYIFSGHTVTLTFCKSAKSDLYYVTTLTIIIEWEKSFYDLMLTFLQLIYTLSFVTVYLFLREYLMPKVTSRSVLWVLFHAITLTSTFLGVILILIARGHYLLDVLLAYFITTAIFYMYHTIVYNKSLRYASHKNFLSRFWWWHLMKYLEFNHIRCTNTSSRANGVCLRCEATNTEVPRKFDWPLPWPRSSERRSTSLQRLLSQT